MNGFKKFILRGNVVDLAVGFVIGAAFASVVKSLVDGVITPLPRCSAPPASTA